jgi:hypothetical protein
MRGRSRKQRQIRAIGAALVLLAVLGVSAGLAMWLEAARARMSPVDFGKDFVAEVVLVHMGDGWGLESVGRVGSNPNFDNQDPERKAFDFAITGARRGEPRAWDERWSVGPARYAGTRGSPGALARAVLGDAISTGAWPWPRELAASDSGARWSPWNQVLDGFGRTRWLGFLDLAALAVFIAFMVRELRAYGVGMCGHCGYSLDGLPQESVCPECGRAICLP